DGTRKYVWSSGLSKESPDFFCAARVSGETAVAWSPDRASETDRRSPRSKYAEETFGRSCSPVGRPGHDSSAPTVVAGGSAPTPLNRTEGLHAQGTRGRPPVAGVAGSGDRATTQCGSGKQSRASSKTRLRASRQIAHFTRLNVCSSLSFSSFVTNSSLFSLTI